MEQQEQQAVLFAVRLGIGWQEWDVRRMGAGISSINRSIYIQLLMKGKKKLFIDRDQELFSPTMLLDSFNQTERGLGKLKARLADNKESTNKQDSNSYFIQIKEPNPTSHEAILSPLRSELQERVDLERSEERKYSNYRESSNKFRSLTEEQELTINRQITRIKEAARSKTAKKTCKLFFQNNNLLEAMVKTQKVRNITKNFVKKVRRSSVYYPPVQYDKVTIQEHTSFLFLKGFELPVLADIVISLLSVIQILSLLIVYTLSIVFDDLMSNYVVLSELQRISLVFYFLEICLNFVTVKFEAGKKLQIIKEIINYYVSHNFAIDFLSFIILFVDITTNLNFVLYCRLFILFKLPECTNKIEKVEVYLVRNIYHQQYWELVKVFLVNFAYAHIISLILILMTSFDPLHNWIETKGIQNSTWLEVYVWSFYWATNMMLTVGFGDIVAVNYLQAIIITFIETFSCIIMAYNINRVGTIISNIRLQDQNRSRKFKTFKKLTSQNSISEELTFRINNYIEESSKMKKHFNLEEDKELMNELPENLRTSYLRQANKEILNKLVFFKTLLDRTLCSFAQKLQTKISHPQEIIRSIDDDFNLIILRKGHIGLICKKKECPFNNYITDQIKIKEGDPPFLTSLDFISKVRPNYEIQSLRFSVLYTLDYQTFIETFRTSDMDYELYCFLRDKCRNIPDQFEVYNCEYCKTYNHYKFTCPRLHYVPYIQHVIDKELHRQKKGSNNRKFAIRAKNLAFTPLEYYKKMRNYQETNPKQKTIANESLAQSNISYREQSGQTESIRKQVYQDITSVYLQNLLDEKTKEGIQMQFLKQENKTIFYDEIWDIKLDQMANYNSYFHHDNPKFLHDKFSLEERLAKNNKKNDGKSVKTIETGHNVPANDRTDKSINQETIRTNTLKAGVRPFPLVHQVQ